MPRPLALLPIAWAVGACSPSSPPAPAPGACHDDALVVVSDYVSSGVGGFSLGGTGYIQSGVDLAADPALSVSGGRAFYVARDLGKLYELDPRCGTPTGAVFDANDPSHPGSANPQDVAVAPDGKLWVARYNVPSVIAIDADGGVARTIDLSSYSPDGNPDANAIAIVDVGGAPTAFVALELLDHSQPMPRPFPDRPSLLLPIDVTTGAARSPIPLAGRNPFGGFVPYGGALWMAEPGDFASSTETLAGIERFDPEAGTSRLVVRESDLGGSVSEVAITSGCAAAIVADASPKNLTSLVTFDPVSGAPLTTAAKPVFGPTADFDLEGMIWVGSALAVGDRTVTPRGYAVHVFDRVRGCSLAERADAIFLPQKPVAFQPSAR